jgi:transcriptional regulator with XRE-family HTH domain
MEFHVTDWNHENTGPRMRAFKEITKKTQQDLAQFLGVSVTSVSRWMNNRNIPDFRTRRTIQNYVEGVGR